MEKEIADLRRRLESNPDSDQKFEHHTGDELSHCSEDAFARRESAATDRPRPVSMPVEPHQSIATPLTMQRDGSILSQEDNTPWKLEDISLSRARVARLFDQYDSPFPSPCLFSFGSFIAQILQLLSSFPPTTQPSQAPRGLSPQVSSFSVDHCLCGQQKIPDGTWSTECYLRSLQPTPMVHHYQCSPRLSCRESTMRPVHMASSNNKPTDRRNIHAQWIDDADCHATGTPSARPSGRVHHFPDGGSRRGSQGPSSHVGNLQHRRPKVSIGNWIRVVGHR